MSESQTDSRDFPRWKRTRAGIRRTLLSFGRHPTGLQRWIGYSGAVTSFLVGLLNFIRLYSYEGLSAVAAFSSIFVWTLLLFGLLFAFTALRPSKFSGGVHVAVLFVAAFLGAETSTPGDVTSAVILILGILLLLEYELGISATVVGLLIAFTTYPVGLLIGYGHSSTATGVSTGQALLFIIDIVMCFGLIFWRHILRQRDQSALLEARVQERTRQLETALEERTVMLQEIHHRVKNNLQMIASMLQMEARKIKNPVLRESTDTSIRRIHAMALVHEVLYQSKPLHNIKLDEYVRKLTRHIQLAVARGVRIDVTGNSQIVTTPDFALPFGLIVNELVTNACRHAFPDDRRGNVEVILARTGGVRLSVMDDGEGLPEGLDVLKEGGLGLTIVRSLVRQLAGSLVVRPNDRTGTCFVIDLPLRNGE